MGLSGAAHYAGCALAMAEASFKALAKRHHPDVGGDTALFQRLNAALATFKAFTEVPYMPHTQTHITLLIDQTASMLPYATQVVDGLNHYMEALCAQTPGRSLPRSKPLRKRSPPTMEAARSTGSTRFGWRPMCRPARRRCTMRSRPSSTRSRRSPGPADGGHLSDGEDMCSGPP